MKIAYHLGIHGTDENALVETLFHNRAVLAAQGVDIPDPHIYRPVLSEALHALNGASAPSSMQELVMDTVLTQEAPERVVFSNRAFLGLPFRAISAGGLYTNAEQRIAALLGLFPEMEAEFFVAMRNPATLVAHILQVVDGASYERMFATFPPETLRWNDAARRIVQAAQGRRVVFWCHEDTPVIWPEVLREVAARDIPLDGEFAMAERIMTPEGAAALTRELGDKAEDMAHRRALLPQVIAAHLRPDQVEIDLDFPGWSQSYVDEITALYESDFAEIAALPGAEIISI